MESIQTERTIDMERVLRVIKRRLWIIVLCLIVTGLVAYAASVASTKKYTASADLVFTNNSAVAAQAAGALQIPVENAQSQLDTNLQLLQSTAGVAQSAAHKLGSGITASQVKHAVSASVQGASDSNVVTVSATWTNPQVAARMANAFATSFIARQTEQAKALLSGAIRLVQQQYRSLSPADRHSTQGQSLLDHIESLKILQPLQVTTQLVHPATAPTAPSSPKPVRNTALGIVIGILLGFGLVAVVDRLDKRLRDSSDVEGAFGLPIVGYVPHANAGARRVIDVAAEPFRMIRAHLRYFSVDQKLSVIVIVSARPGEGKTTVARGIGGAAASIGTRTLLIEADLRRPSLASVDPELRGVEGLSSALVEIHSFDKVVCEVDSGLAADEGMGCRLHVMPAGVIPPNPAALLESQAMQSIVAWARENYELVVIDTAPIEVVSDAIPLLTVADGVILVTRLGLSVSDSARRVRQVLDQVGAHALGVVVNDVKRGSDGYYGYDYVGAAGDSTPRSSVALRRVPEDVFQGSESS